MPFLALIKSKLKEEFDLLNVGNGVAINIKIDDVILNSEFDFRLVLEGPLCLRPGERAMIKVETKKAGTTGGISLTAHLDTRYANRQHTVTIYFCDVLHRKYKQELSLGKNGPVIGQVVAVAGDHIA